MTERPPSSWRTSGSCPSLPGWLPPATLHAFAQFATFRDVAQAVKVHVSTERICASRSPRMLCWAIYFFIPPVPARQRVPLPRAHLRTGFHRRTYGIAIDGDDVVEILLHKRKVSSPMRFTATPSANSPRVADQPDDLHPAPLSGRRSFRFHGNHFDLRHQLFDQYRQPAARPPPPTGTNTRSRWASSGAVPAPACLARRSPSDGRTRHPGEALLL